MADILTIYNPAAGRKNSLSTLKAFGEYLEAKGMRQAVLETSLAPGVLTEQISWQLQQHPFLSVVIIGGDGTINEVVNSLPEFTIPVGFIANGSGNDFVKMLNIGKTLTEQFHTAVYGRVLRCDVGICNGRKFLNGVGVGFDGQIVANMLEKKKFLWGQAAYYAEVLKILATYREKPFTFSTDGLDHSRNLILLTIGNGTTFGGGFKLTPNASVTDGLLDICSIGKLSALSRFRNILKLQNGTHHLLQAVQMFRAKKINISENKLLKAHIDGEYAGSPPFDISVKPAILPVRTGNQE